MPERTKVIGLRSDPPITLRPTAAIGAVPLRRWSLHDPRHAWVGLAAAAAGPIGGDTIRIEVDVDDGATLIARNVAATLVLPGPHGQQSRTDVTIRVGAEATLVWSPGPVIAARGCDHRTTTRVTLAPGARLFALDELVLGRHHEQCGIIRQRTRVCLDDGPLYDQELEVGPAAPGSDGPAVTGGRRAIGSALIVDEEWAEEGVFNQPAVAVEATVARLPLEGPGTLVTALAPDLVALRRGLAASITDLEDLSIRLCDQVRDG
jgi:urease accessory protein